MYGTLFLALILAPLAGAAQGPFEAAAPPVHVAVAERHAPLPAWEAADTADTLYRQARRALNAGETGTAATLFNRIHSRHPVSAYAADAYYWEAFARHRIGGESNLRRALALLEEQGRLHPSARTRSDARALATRIRGSLAQAGDRASSERLAGEARRSGQGCEDADLRAAALMALARSEPDEAAALAGQVLGRRDECSTVLREHAVHLLARQGTPDATRLLRDVVRRDPSSRVQEAALYALARTAGEVDELIRLYEGLEETRHREALLYAIQRRGGADRAQAFLRDRLADPREDARLREAALFALSRGAPARELIELYPRLDEPRLKEAALHRIAASDDPAARRFLRERAMDDSEPVRIREAALYRVVGSGDASEAVRLYRGLDETRLRAAVLHGLAGMRADREAVDLLIEIARTERNRPLRETAIHALAGSDDPRARAFLRELVTQP